MHNIVLFGGPGSGKGTQSQRLIDRYGYHHISTGDVLRDHIRRGTHHGRVAEGYINQGQLIPDQLMLDILESEMDAHPEDIKQGIIFDGFPRTIPQAEALRKLMQSRGSDIHTVIGLEVPDEIMATRLELRGKESGRSDDNPETIRKRLKVYHDQTSPLRDFYIKEGTYRPIDGSATIEEIAQEIAKIVEADR